MKQPKFILAVLSGILFGTASALALHLLGVPGYKALATGVLVYGGVLFAITAIGIAIDERK